MYNIACIQSPTTKQPVAAAPVNHNCKRDGSGFCAFIFTLGLSSSIFPHFSISPYHRSSMPRPRPRPHPHPLALFSLVPLPENERAERVVSHPSNSHHVSTLFDGTLALDVGFHIRGKSSKTLATLGRGVDVDIYVEGFSIARVQ